jgi:hypothetical protein
MLSWPRTQGFKNTITMALQPHTRSQLDCLFTPYLSLTALQAASEDPESVKLRRLPQLLSMHPVITHQHRHRCWRWTKIVALCPVSNPRVVFCMNGRLLYSWLMCDLSAGDWCGFHTDKIQLVEWSTVQDFLIWFFVITPCLVRERKIFECYIRCFMGRWNGFSDTN